MRCGELKGLVIRKAGLFGRLESTKELRGVIGCGIKTVAEYAPEDEYQGEYETVSKAFQDSYLETKNKRLRKNIRVKEIPYYEASNPSDGVTVYIGGDIEIE